MSVIERETAEKTVKTPRKNMSKDEMAKEILRRAMLRLSKRGAWIAGTEVKLKNPDLDLQVSELENGPDWLPRAATAPMCAIGAIRYEALLLGEESGLAEWMLAEAIMPGFVEQVDGDGNVGYLEADEVITTYNDARSEKRQVIRRFRKAIGLR